MNNQQLIESMIPVLLAKRLRLSTVDTAAHPSTQCAYEFLGYEDDMAIVVSIDGTILTFPADEVFNPNILMEMCFDRKFCNFDTCPSDF